MVLLGTAAKQRPTAACILLTLIGCLMWCGNTARLTYLPQTSLAGDEEEGLGTWGELLDGKSKGIGMGCDYRLGQFLQHFAVLKTLGEVPGSHLIENTAGCCHCSREGARDGAGWVH